MGATEYQMNTGKHSKGPNDTAAGDQPYNAFGSVHLGGAQFVLCDRSVQFIIENVSWNDNLSCQNDQGVYHSLDMRTDGNVMGEF